jgi:undecaprenyl-diphosphatase
LHLATLFAVVLYFRADLFCLCKAGFLAPKSADGRLFWLIGLATLPAAAAGYLFEDAAENIFRNPLLIAAALMIFALFLYQADRKADKTSSARALSWRVMLIIGFAQALAIMPGVSRVEGARISFLLSIPIIFGAAVLQLKDISAQQLNAPLFAGFAAAFIVGWLVIKFLMKYIQSHNFNIFVYYRLALGALIIALYFLKA